MNKKNLKFTLLGRIYHEWKLNRFRRFFFKRYSSCDFLPMNIFNVDLFSSGKFSYGELNVLAFNNDSKLIIGNYVSIAQNVFFHLSTGHNLNTFSTFPFKVKLLGNVESESCGKGDIVVEDDVWIGFGSQILSGVRIGRGAVVAAGSVVTKDVPPYAIVGGVPAKVIRYRFSETIINKLMNIDFLKLNKNIVKDNIELFYSSINENNIDELISSIKNN